MSSVQTYLDKFGRNFLVASMIPSLAFFTITMLSLQPVLPDWLKDILGSEFNPLGESGLLLILLTVIAGFTLTSLNTFVYKVFEGYVLIWRLPSLRKSEIKRSRQQRNIQTKLAKKVDRLESGVLSKRTERKREDLIATQKALIAKYDLAFPPNEDEILPTKFGNILKAAETYPMSRYRIDSVPLWPRLIHVMPNSYYTKVDEISNQLSFLMNCTILATIYALVALGISLYYSFESIWIITKSPEKIWGYFGLFLLALCISIVFLRASELVVLEYGYLIRSSFDLFRRALLKQLDLLPPLTLEDEQELWERICNFINMGDKDGLAYFNFQPVSEPQAHQNKVENVDN